MVYCEEEEIRKAKAKYQTIVASHTEWDDYCLSDDLDDEYSLSDMVGERPQEAKQSKKKKNKGDL